jgi:hypothetical protein
MDILTSQLSTGLIYSLQVEHLRLNVQVTANHILIGAVAAVLVIWFEDFASI